MQTMQLSSKYVAYHEAGHALALLHSKSLDVGEITFDKNGWYVSPVLRNRKIGEVNADILLDKAMVACAGMAAGAVFQERNGLQPELQDLAEPLESDMEQCMCSLQQLGMNETHSQELLAATFEFFRTTNVWNQLLTLAEHLFYEKNMRMTGDEVRTLLQHILPHGGKGLPIPPHLLKFGASNTLLPLPRQSRWWGRLLFDRICRALTFSR